MATFTREELEAKTAVELKRMCVEQLKIPGMTKKAKPIVIDAILAKYGRDSETPSASVTPSTEPTPTPEPTPNPTPGKMNGLSFSGQSIMTKPDAPFGHKTTTTIQVSCGASMGNFPVAGRPVGDVREFLKEVLNVDLKSVALVNGKETQDNYVLKQGDVLEFLKPAGKKG